MFNFSKIYDKINWRNKPDKTTPIDATNLGKIDAALNTIDDRVVELGKKANDTDDAINELNSNLTNADQVYFGYGVTDSFGFIRLKRPNLHLIPCGVFSNSGGYIAQLMYLDVTDKNYFFVKVKTREDNIPVEGSVVEVYVKFSLYRNNNLEN